MIAGNAERTQEVAAVPTSRLAMKEANGNHQTGEGSKPGVISIAGCQKWDTRFNPFDWHQTAVHEECYVLRMKLESEGHGPSTFHVKR